MVGVAIINRAGDKWHIDTFLMSCNHRRQAERSGGVKCRDASEAGCVSISAEYIPTAKNNLVADFSEKQPQEIGIR